MGFLKNLGGALLGGSSSIRNWAGGALNDITGKTQSAKQQYQHQLALQKDAQEFSKWQMANAHQMEIEDLKKAGLNPALSAGGGGASAGVSMGSASDGGAGINPLAMIEQAVNSMNSAKMTNAQTEKLQADILNETAKAQAEVTKALTDAGYTKKQIDYYVKHGVFPGATITTSGNTSIGWGAASGGRSTTIPVGMNGTTHGNNSAKAFKNMSKEKWNKLSKTQKLMFPKELRDLYNETYKD